MSWSWILVLTRQAGPLRLSAAVVPRREMTSLMPLVCPFASRLPLVILLRFIFDFGFGKGKHAAHGTYGTLGCPRRNKCWWSFCGAYVGVLPPRHPAQGLPMRLGGCCLDMYPRLPGTVSQHQCCMAIEERTFSKARSRARLDEVTPRGA